MRKIISFMHVSLDGFVAGPKGEMNWIYVDEEIFDFGGRFYNNAGSALYGRVTFDMMEGYWPTAADKPNASKHDVEHSRWYMKVDKIVLSKTLTSKPGVKVIADNLVEEIRKIKGNGDQDIVIFGSPRATHALMQHDLVDEFWIFLNPILVGQGTPLFKNIHEMRKLDLKDSKTFSSGVVALHYSRK